MATLFKPAKVIICGGRTWFDRDAITDTISQLADHYGSERLLIITGGARGADRMAEESALAAGIHTARVPALWDTHHRAAGPIRNRMMLGLDPDRVVGFHTSLDASRGTANMLTKAHRSDVECWLHDGKDLRRWNAA